jgi:hypothetical protein
MSDLGLIAEKRPQDCWDWITPEELSRMVLRSFDLARKACRPPAGERFLDANGAWAGRQSFAQDLALLVELHVKAEAHAMGIGGQDFASEAARLLRWLGKGRDPVGADQIPSTTNRLAQEAA